MKLRVVVDGKPFDENDPPCEDAVRGWRVETRYFDISKDEMAIPADWFLTGRNHRKSGDALLKDEVAGRMDWYVEVDDLSTLKKLQDSHDGSRLSLDFHHENGPTVTVLAGR